MARRRNRKRPGGWPDPEYEFERHGIEMVVKSLEAEGRTVSELWYPDQDRDDPRVVGRTTPDAALQVDGQAAAVDITQFWDQVRGKAARRATAIARGIRATLKERELLLWPVGMLLYRPLVLAKLDDPAAQSADGLRIAEAMAGAAGAGPVERLVIDEAQLPAWVDRLTVSTVD